MGQKTETVRTGDSPAVGLAGNFIDFLEPFLTGSGVGTRPIQMNDGPNRTGGIASILNDILSGGAGKLGGSLQELVQQSINDEVGAVRARFGASGGTSRGTPAAVAESVVRSRAAPQLAATVGNLQLQTILPLLQLVQGLSGRGLPQLEDSVLVKDNPLITGLGAVSGLARAGGAALQGVNA